MAGVTRTTGRRGGDVGSWGRALASPFFCLQTDSRAPPWRGYVILECERQRAEASPSEPRTGPPGPGARWKPKPAVGRLPPQPHHFPVRGVAARGPRVGWWTQPQPRAVCSFVVRGEGGCSELSGQDGFLAPAPCPRQALQIHRHIPESFAMQRSSSLHRPNGLACEPNPAGCPR